MLETVTLQCILACRGSPDTPSGALSHGQDPLQTF